MTWACSSRTGGTGRSVPPDPPNTAAVTTETEPRAEPVEPARGHSAPDECALIALPGEPIATVGLSDRIDSSNARNPSNASERLLFRQLYETLVRIDCQGRVRPGLAASWRIG